MKSVRIYCDGACLGNPGRGGFAGILIYRNVEKEISGSLPDTTNNRAELSAAIHSVNALKEPCNVVLRTDSEYVVKGMNEWLHKWKANGWRTSDRKEVANKELWERLEEVSRQHEMTWIWTKGHAGNTYNERCDNIAKRKAGGI